jgi:hypothetical protein
VYSVVTLSYYCNNKLKVCTVWSFGVPFTAECLCCLIKMAWSNELMQRHSELVIWFEPDPGCNCSEIVLWFPSVFSRIVTVFFLHSNDRRFPFDCLTVFVCYFMLHNLCIWGGRKTSLGTDNSSMKSLLTAAAALSCFAFLQSVCTRMALGTEFCLSLVSFSFCCLTFCSDNDYVGTLETGLLRATYCSGIRRDGGGGGGGGAD